MLLTCIFYILILWVIVTLLLLFLSTDLGNLRIVSITNLSNALLTILSFFAVSSLIMLSFLYQSLNAFGEINMTLTIVTTTCTSFTTLYYPFIYIFLLVTLLTLYFCFAYNRSELNVFSLYVTFILISGLGLFSTSSLFLFFLFYEALLLPSFFILYHFAKTRKAVEAAYLMFFWTQFGAMSLIFNFQYLFFITSTTQFSLIENSNFSNFEHKFLFLTLLIGFGVKFPIWPFYDWLPKAHVEASTNFSIFLSGVLVKFALFGFIRYLFILGLEAELVFIYPFLTIGILDASSKVYYQIDLKKLIAYATVIEMHWLLIALLSGYSVLWLSAFAMLISHALLSSNFFLIVDAVTRRFKTRLLTELNGLFYLTPILYFVLITLLVVFLGFPGSLFFIAEFLFFSFLLDINLIIFIFLIFILYFYVPVCFFKNWFFLMFGYSQHYTNNTPVSDLDLKEQFIFWFFIVILFWFGFTFQFFF